MAKKIACAQSEAVPDPELIELLQSLVALSGLHLAAVSGRPRDVLERYFSDSSIWLVAEHGAWCRFSGAWQPTIDLDPAPVQAMADRVEAIASLVPGARVERKTWSGALHYRQVQAHGRAALAVEATIAIDRFLAEQPSQMVRI